MKTVFVLFLALAAYSASAEDDLAPNVREQVMIQLRANPAVRGALAEAKQWAGAASCDNLAFEETSATTFKVYASCDNPGDPKAEAKAGVGLGATGQIHVSGTIQYGLKKNSPVKVQIDHIEFAYAG